MRWWNCFTSFLAVYTFTRFQRLFQRCQCVMVFPICRNDLHTKTWIIDQSFTRHLAAKYKICAICEARRGHRDNRSGANPLRALFVIREALSRRIKRWREREREGAKEEGQSDHLPVRSDLREWETEGSELGEKEEAREKEAKRESNENESRRAQFVVALICHRVPPAPPLPLVTYHLARLLRFHSSSVHTLYIHYFHRYYHWVGR